MRFRIHSGARARWRAGLAGAALAAAVAAAPASAEEIVSIDARVVPNLEDAEFSFAAVAAFDALETGDRVALDLEVLVAPRHALDAHAPDGSVRPTSLCVAGPLENVAELRVLLRPEEGARMLPLRILLSDPITTPGHVAYCARRDRLAAIDGAREDAEGQERLSSYGAIGCFQAARIPQGSIGPATVYLTPLPAEYCEDAT